MRVIVTRPQGDASGWVRDLNQASFAAVPLPLIAIAPAADRLAIEMAWCALEEYVALMFVSGNAVSHFFREKPPEDLVRTAFPAPKIRAWAPGPGTANALRQAGVDASLIDAPAPGADQFDSQALWALVRDQVQAGSKVLIVRGESIASDGGDGGDTGFDFAFANAAITAASAGAKKLGSGAAAGRNWLADQITRVGAKADYLTTYRRLIPRFSEGQRALARSGASDGSVWLFSSSEAVANLAAAMPLQTWSGARAVATHARIAATARSLGFGVVCESRPELASVVASIESMR